MKAVCNTHKALTGQLWNNDCTKPLHACISFTYLQHMTNRYTTKEGSDENRRSLAVKIMQTVCLVLCHLRVSVFVLIGHGFGIIMIACAIFHANQSNKQKQSQYALWFTIIILHVLMKWFPTRGTCTWLFCYIYKTDVWLSITSVARNVEVGGPT